MKLATGCRAPEMRAAVPWPFTKKATVSGACLTIPIEVPASISSATLRSRDGTSLRAEASSDSITSLALLGAVLEAGPDLLRHKLRGLGRKGLAVLIAHFQAEEDCLADVGEGFIQRVALGDAAGHGWADDGVAAVGFRGEDYGELHGVRL